MKPKLYKEPTVVLSLETLAKLIDEVYSESVRAMFMMRNETWCEKKFNEFKYQKVREILKG